MYRLHWVFIALCRLYLVEASGATLWLQCRSFRGGGFSCYGAQALGLQASVVAAHGLSGCGACAWSPPSMWDPPRSGIQCVP